MSHFDEPTFLCLTCFDTGFVQPIQCPTEMKCQRRRPHLPHQFTARCKCWLERNADQLEVSRQTALAKNRPIPHECDDLQDLKEGRYPWIRPR